MESLPSTATSAATPLAPSQPTTPPRSPESVPWSTTSAFAPQAAQTPRSHPPPQPPPNALKPRPIPGPPAKAVTPKLAPKPPAPQQAQIVPPQPTPSIPSPAPVERSATAPPPLPPAPPAPPAFRTVTIPADSTIPVRITQTLDSATTQQGESFTGVVATDVIIDGLVALPQGTPVTGRVSAVQEAAHYKGNSLLSIELTNINPKGEHIAVSTEQYTKEGAGRGKNTAEKVGGGAAVGAILGGILGGGKGAAIGAAAGGGVGAGANTVTRGQQVQIPSETLVQFRLTNSVAVRASTRDPGTRDRDASSDNQQRRPLDSPPQ